ncbi:hypothetical protein [Paenibacillus sp. MBLB4367]|uniref:hypothetical protein n=1 Tax=Paenibacillus sp. MBLB4367 TaxID=3384767 RepID=UPI00390835F6
MAWVNVLSMEQLEIVVDDERKQCMIELSSSGSVPRYVTLHIDEAEQLETIIRALKEARQILQGASLREAP